MEESERGEEEEEAEDGSGQEEGKGHDRGDEGVGWAIKTQVSNEFSLTVER